MRSPITSPARRRPQLLLGALVLTVLMLTLAACGGGGSSSSGKAPEVPTGVPTILSESDLRAYARAQAVPVYWVGPQADRQYETTHTKAGRYYVRYLPKNVKAGDPTPGYLTVGTYPGANAYGALQIYSRQAGKVAVQTQSGALVVHDKAKPTSYYFAFPGQDFQVEVFSPVPGEAKSLVLDGKAQRIR